MTEEEILELLGDNIVRVPRDYAGDMDAFLGVDYIQASDTGVWFGYFTDENPKNGFADFYDEWKVSVGGGDPLTGSTEGELGS